MRTVKSSYFVCIIALMPLLGLSGCDFTVCPTFSVIAALINTYDLYVAGHRWRCDAKAFDLVKKRHLLVLETSRGRLEGPAETAPPSCAHLQSVSDSFLKVRFPFRFFDTVKSYLLSGNVCIIYFLLFLSQPEGKIVAAAAKVNPN